MTMQSRQIAVACVNNSDAQQISNVQQVFESDSRIVTGTVCKNISILCKTRVHAHVPTLVHACVIARVPACVTLKLKPELSVKISTGFVLNLFLAVQNSSLGDLVTQSLTHSLTQGSFTFEIQRATQET